MKQLLMINGDLHKSDSTAHLIAAYRKGAEAAGAQIRELAIVDLIFNSNKQFNNDLTELEPDLRKAMDALIWSNHVVVFCPVYISSIPARITGFFDRLLTPDQISFHKGHSTTRNFSGKSARIISILDEQTFEYWKEDKSITYLSIKRSIFENSRFHPVLTNTIGQLHSIDNNYSKKWLRKLETFGNKLI